MYILLILDGMFCGHQLSLSGLMCHLKSASLFILFVCLDDLSIDVSEVLKSPTIIVLLLISPFIVISICLLYCGAPLERILIPPVTLVFDQWKNKLICFP